MQKPGLPKGKVTSPPRNYRLPRLNGVHKLSRKEMIKMCTPYNSYSFLCIYYEHQMIVEEISRHFWLVWFTCPTDRPFKSVTLLNVRASFWSRTTMNTSSVSMVVFSEHWSYTITSCASSASMWQVWMRRSLICTCQQHQVHAVGTLPCTYQIGALQVTQKHWQMYHYAEIQRLHVNRIRN